METIDDDIVARRRLHRAPTLHRCAVLRLGQHDAHALLHHPKPESVGQSGRWQSTYHDTMIDHDKHVGLLLDKLGALGIAEDTIVIYSTDNGPHQNTWPDAGTTPFRSEKNTNWEGAFRVPELIRWPGQIPPASCRTRSSSITTGCRRCSQPPATRPSRTSSRAARSEHDVPGAHRRLQPAPLPHRRDRRIAAQRVRLLLRRRRRVGAALRQLEGRVHGAALRGTLQVWAEPFVPLRLPKLFNLRTDPYERADVTSNTYYQWILENAYLVFAAERRHRGLPQDDPRVPAAAEGRLVHDRPGARQAQR